MVFRIGKRSASILGAGAIVSVLLALSVPANADVDTTNEVSPKLSAESESYENVNEFGDKVIFTEDALGEYFRDAKNPDHEKFFQLDQINGSIILYLTDELSGEAAKFVDGTSEKFGLPIKTEYVDISASTWSKIGLEVHEKLLKEFPEIVSSGINARELGFVISVDEKSDPDVKAIQRAFQSIAKTKLDVKVDKSTVGVENGSRLDDSSPYAGGGRLKFRSFLPGTTTIWQQSQCTAGFTATKNATGSKVMVIAKHCREHDDGAMATVVKTLDNITISESFAGGGGPSIDAIYMYGYGTRTYQGNVFSGAYNSSSGRVVQYAGTGPTMATEAYVSGSFSGETRVDYDCIDCTVTVLGGSTRVHMNLYSATTGLKRFGAGDSGAPVYSVISNGNVSLKGIHNGSRGTHGSCYGGDPDRPNNSCAAGGWGADIDWIESENNITALSTN